VGGTSITGGPPHVHTTVVDDDRMQCAIATAGHGVATDGGVAQPMLLLRFRSAVATDRPAWWASQRPDVRRSNAGRIEPQEGTRIGGRDNSPSTIADHETDQHPEVDAPGTGAGGIRQGTDANGERVGATDEVPPLPRGRKPLKREPWTWQQDETGLRGDRRRNPSRVCETLRAERRWSPGSSPTSVDSDHRGREEGRKPHGRRSMPKGSEQAPTRVL
jgi:hypothetical protein